MIRRRAMLALAGGGLTATAGCLDQILSDGETDPGPNESAESEPNETDAGPTGRNQTEVVQAYFAAMESQDADGLNGLIHPEKNTSISPVQLRQFENSTITVNAMRVKDISDESAIVRVDTTVRREPAITPTTNLLEVRTHDGEWYVWGEPEGFAPTGLSPDAVIKTFWESINDGDFTLANSLVHPDSPEGKISVRAEPEWNKRTIIVDRVETVEQTEERAIVDIEMTWSMETEEGVQETTVDTSYELRSIDGEWRLWSQQTD